MTKGFTKNRGAYSFKGCKWLGVRMKPKTLEDVIKLFAMKFKKGATDLNDETTAAMFAAELAGKIRKWEADNVA